MSYIVVRDKDEEWAKQCLNLKCKKIFYFGNECPFCREEIKTEQNLIKAICPDCNEKNKIVVKNIIGLWIEVANKKALPSSLPTERCPSCLLTALRGNTKALCE